MIPVNARRVDASDGCARLVRVLLRRVLFAAHRVLWYDRRMPAYKRHVFVCTHGTFCWYDGEPEELLEALKKMAAAAGLRDEIRINRSGCLNACGHGPSMVVYPEGVWYGHVQVDDAREIFEQHLLHGEPVERLRLAPDFVKRTEDYPEPVQQFKRTERALDDQRRAAQEAVRQQVWSAE